MFIADDCNSYQLHVSASNRPSSGCTSNENVWGLYNIQFNFYLMTRSRIKTEVTLYIVQPPTLFI